MLDTEVTKRKFAGNEFPLQTDKVVMTLLGEMLSNQYVFFAEESKDWKGAWGKLPKTTNAITADTTVSQLR
ncbi:hypothetical protein [Marinobacter sp.]|uniref:hypothetical protein n=1 Tax=Marinobacter sp. TaxID=50741 RepID=UPI003297E3BE